ncbi:MAG: adenosylcobinamide-GDP ribazoletransferase [Gammaproteobacteria bacterium]|uniref:adenosylcobinamide-GDP ribazoletransferase n=1 Tax=Marinomonas sp. BSi20584 TaxID=1594462 RepID=UPI000C1E236F|nr:adenosylcobinamide-GDP ribazoletransferase [Marinomonas sp. BSi20584]MBU1297139.1 adenosylcobinamide-GDP ribazoletransferase [Gammaproteobacteria bacterium]MBU1465577.1 adenosylcobinamide-GDP ribazoletransferase [Gammaproteobacteria bacterium]MBU2238105.1 adenosylcobinamide-GDP ribazoletransferase [Gammaproteobacteria bacterium]MBU2318425.1 adenosylcobinamide-GDP ribazoletransferase [Gammaproteobacteria bacterium]MBU2413548.1 adenosylcobinamide-GDP ribazoletransferase [Gammaproteobacteria b
MKGMIIGPYWQGFKRSLVTYTRIPLKVDWSDDIKHIPAVCFLPWIGLVVGLLSAWPLWFDWSTSLQALVMLLSAVLLTGGFHEDGLMDSCDGLVGGWNKEQRLSIMKDSRIGSYAALSIWFSLTLKWLLLSELLQVIPDSFLGFVYTLSGWCVVHIVARFIPLVLMNTLDYVTMGQSKASSMIAKLNPSQWLVALAPCLLVGVLAFNLFDLILTFIFAAVLVFLMRLYLRKKIDGFNGDTLGASEQIGEIFVVLCLLVSYS